MSRELKFRAWDKRAKRWIRADESGLIMLDFETAHTGAFYLFDDSYSGHEWYEIMQFTGLRDKNGREIYEGDVLQYDVPNCLSERRREPNPKVMFYTVEWQDNGFYAKSHHAYPYHENKFWPHIHNDCAVIGNLYENPELLK